MANRPRGLASGAVEPSDNVAYQSTSQDRTYRPLCLGQISDQDVIQPRCALPSAIASEDLVEPL